VLAKKLGPDIEGKRSLNIGRLRPNVLLYGEPHPDNKEYDAWVQIGEHRGVLKNNTLADCVLIFKLSFIPPPIEYVIKNLFVAYSITNLRVATN